MPLLPRERYTHELNELQLELLALGRLCDDSIRRAMWALHQRAPREAGAIVRNDDRIDAAADSLIDRAMHVLATQAPVATDLRLVRSYIQCAGELERIGDYAEGIAKLISKHADVLPAELPPQLATMAEGARRLLDAALQALVARDPSANLRLKDQDDQIDELYDRAFAELTSAMQGDPAMVVPGTYLIWVAHNLERIADRATNIGEYVEYVVSGRISRRRRAAP